MARPPKPLKRQSVHAQVRVDYILAMQHSLTLPGDFAPRHGAISTLIENLIGEWLIKKGAVPNGNDQQPTG